MHTRTTHTPLGRTWQNGGFSIPARHSRDQLIACKNTARTLCLPRFVLWSDEHVHASRPRHQQSGRGRPATALD
jgi:hypothetical protein